MLVWPLPIPRAPLPLGELLCWGPACPARPVGRACAHSWPRLRLGADTLSCRALLVEGCVWWAASLVLGCAPVSPEAPETQRLRTGLAGSAFSCDADPEAVGQNACSVRGGPVREGSVEGQVSHFKTFCDFSWAVLVCSFVLHKWDMPSSIGCVCALKGSC